MAVTRSVQFDVNDFDGKMWAGVWKEIASDLSVSFGHASVHVSSDCDGFEQYCFSISDLAKESVKRFEEGTAGELELISMANELKKAAVLLRAEVETRRRACCLGTL